MSELNLELLGIHLDDIESCLKLITDLQKDPKMIKKINWNTSAYLDRLTETSQDSEEFCAKTANKWKREYASCGYEWERLVPKNKRLRLNQDSDIDWKNSEVAEWLSELGEEYDRYAELFKREDVDGTVLLELTIQDFQEMGIAPLHYLKIIIELQKLQTGRSYLLLPWSPDEVIRWLENYQLNDNPDEIKTQKVNGDLLCVLTKDALTADLKFTELTAQKIVELRKELKLERCCFGMVLAEKEIEERVYELFRKGRVTTSLLLKEEAFFTPEEKSYIKDIPPTLLKKLREFSRTCG